MREPINKDTKMAVDRRSALRRFLFHVAASYSDVAPEMSVETSKSRVNARSRETMACEKSELWNGYPWFGL